MIVPPSLYCKAAAVTALPQHLTLVASLMDCLELLGFLAAFLMFSTFYMKNMIPLRIIGMASNATFIIYAVNVEVWPLLVLHTALLPMNFFRLIQMLKLIKKVRSASEDGMSFDFMIPHMHKEKLQENEIVFHRGDKADKIYLLKSGILTVDELNVVIKPGELFGEMGVFASEPIRGATLRCGSEVELLSMTDKQIKQLYYQNPQFGFYLIQLLLKRFSQNKGHVDVEKKITTTTRPEEKNEGFDS